MRSVSFFIPKHQNGCCVISAFLNKYEEVTNFLTLYMCLQKVYDRTVTNLLPLKVTLTAIKAPQTVQST